MSADAWFRAKVRLRNLLRNLRNRVLDSAQEFDQAGLKRFVDRRVLQARSQAAQRPYWG